MARILLAFFSVFVSLHGFLAIVPPPNFQVDKSKVIIMPWANTGHMRINDTATVEYLPKVPLKCTVLEYQPYCHILCQQNKYEKGQCDSEQQCMCTRPDGAKRIYLMDRLKNDENYINRPEKDPFPPSEKGPQGPDITGLHPREWDQCICDNYKHCVCNYSSVGDHAAP